MLLSGQLLASAIVCLSPNASLASNKESLLSSSNCELNAICTSYIGSTTTPSKRMVKESTKANPAEKNHKVTTGTCTRLHTENLPQDSEKLN